MSESSRRAILDPTYGQKPNEHWQPEVKRRVQRQTIVIPPTLTMECHNAHKAEVRDCATAEQKLIADLRHIGFVDGQDYVIGVSNYAYCIVIDGDRLLVYETTKEETPDGNNWVKGRQIFNGFRSIWEKAKNGDGNDIFIFPNKLVGGMSNHHATKFDTVFFEIDPPKGLNIRTELQNNREKIRALAADYGLVPSLQIYSGNKSDHNYFKLSCPVDLETWFNLMRKMAIAVGSDPNIVTPGRKMRCPHVFRVVGKAQRYCKSKQNDTVYDPAELEAILDKIIWDKYKVESPKHFSKLRFTHYKRAEGIEQIKEVIERPESMFHEIIDEHIDTNDIPAKALQSVALKALKVIPESEKGGGTYETTFRPMAGGLKELFGADVAIQLLTEHSPSRAQDAVNCVKTLNKFSAISFFRMAKAHGFVWDEEDAAILQDYFHDDIVRLYAEHHGNPEKLSKELWQVRKKFQSFRCSDYYWQQECKAIAAEHNFDLVLGASPDWWTRYMQDMAILGTWDGEAALDKSDYGIWASQISPWINRFKARQKYQFSHRHKIKDRVTTTMGNLPYYDGETEYEVLIDSQADRDEVLEKLNELGFKLAIDVRATGTGKNHQLLNTGLSNVVVFLEEHRNPSVPGFKDKFFEMPTRNNGMYLWSDSKVKRSPEFEGQPTMDAGNCEKAPDFLKAIANGQNLEIDSPCSTCRHFETCGKDIPDRPPGSGFLNFRKWALKKLSIRSHLTQFNNLDEFYLSLKYAIVDESGAQLKTVYKQKIDFAKLRETAAFVRNFDHRWGYEVGKFLDALEDIYHNHNGKYGITHEQLIELLPAYEGDLKHYLKGLLGARRMDGGVNMEAMDALYWESQMADNTNADRALPFEPLSDLVRVWSGNQGSISINADGVISITMPDKRTVNMLKKFKSVLLMDATPNLEDIAHQFGIKESEILVLNSAVPDNSRLTINCIETPGFGSRNLSEAAIARGDAIIEKVKEQDPHTKVIAYKNGAIVCDGYWGNHTRGSNEFVGTQTMVLVGAPFPNLGEIQDNYRAQHGHLVGFEEYYNHLVAAEIIQAVGRQRAHRFQSNFNIFHICTGINPSFLEHLGCRVNLIHAAQIDPSLGSVSQSKRYTLAQVAMQMAETGIKVTQAAIAEVLGVTQSAVSQILKEFRGGWQGFKKEILGDLLNNTKSALYFSKSAANLDDWAGFDVASAMILTIDLVRSQDWATLKTMLNESTPEKRHWATAIMLNLFGIAPPNSPES